MLLKFLIFFSGEPTLAIAAIQFGFNYFLVSGAYATKSKSLFF